MNPSRSGDTELIYWMFKNRGDFYYEDFRTVACQTAIIESALRDFPELAKQIKDTRRGKSRWLRNVEIYLGMCTSFSLFLSLSLSFSLLLSLSLSRTHKHTYTYIRTHDRCTSRRSNVSPTCQETRDTANCGHGAGSCHSGGAHGHDSC